MSVVEWLALFGWNVDANFPVTGRSVLDFEGWIRLAIANEGAVSSAHFEGMKGSKRPK